MSDCQVATRSGIVPSSFSVRINRQEEKDGEQKMSLMIDDPYNVTGLTNEELVILNKKLLDLSSKGTLDDDGKGQLAAVEKEVSKRNL